MSDSSKDALPLTARLQALLFVAAEPVTAAELAESAQVNAKVVEEALQELEAALVSTGLRLQRLAGRVQLTTAPELASQVERFLGLEARSHLTRSALETLAIVAYNQPATRPQIDSVRGVNSETMLKSLLAKGLIHEMGRSEGPGRPILYATTPDFLQHLGLSSIAALPPLQIAAAGESPDELLKG